MKTYFPTINLFRGIAALMVCVYHFISYADFRGQLFAAGGKMAAFGTLGINGVFIFFVISGFVIPLSLSKDHFKLPQLHRFLARRFIRIELPYLASILLILFLGFLFALKNHAAFVFSIQQLIYHIVYLIPFSTFEWYNPIYWTLAIEFQFYIVIGLLYFFLSSSNKMAVMAALLVFGALGFLVHDHRFIFNYSTIFLQGILLFMIKTGRINTKAGVALILVCVAATAYLHSIGIALFSGLTVAGIQYLQVNNRWSNRFGEISYSLYLTHGLIGGNILYLFARYIHSFSGKILLLMAAVGASLVFSYLFWRWIENPSRQLSRKVKVK